MNNSSLDPEISAYLANAQQTLSTAHLLTAPEVRKVMQELRLKPTEVTDVYRVNDLAIPTASGSLKCRLYQPSDQHNLPLLVWFHGGGWVLGDLDSADMTCRDLSSLSGCMVLSVDYRLAPEHPFPAAFDDAVAALRYAFDQASELGADINRIAIGGDSAGANLAACACNHSRNLPVKFQLLIYPVVEASFDNASYTENAENCGLTRELMKWFWLQYVPDEATREDDRVAPLNSDLVGLPPAWVMVVDLDPLRDEGLKYATALQNNSVPVEVETAAGTIHGFFSMPTNGSYQARKTAASRLKESLM